MISLGGYLGLVVGADGVWGGLSFLMDGFSITGGPHHPITLYLFLSWVIGWGGESWWGGALGFLFFLELWGFLCGGQQRNLTPPLLPHAGHQTSFFPEKGWCFFRPGLSEGERTTVRYATRLLFLISDLGRPGRTFSPFLVRGGNTRRPSPSRELF